MSRKDKQRKRELVEDLNALTTAPTPKVRRHEEKEAEESEKLEWWKKGVIYQVYPRSFMDSSGNGTGDLGGIESKLDHFVELGITTLWLSPIYKSPMKDFGYDISDYTQIDPLFGTMEDFRSLVTVMKKKGLRLVMDFVPNHTSDQHQWFNSSVRKESTFSDYYVWHYGKTSGKTQVPPNNWLSVFGGSAWTWSEEREEFYLHQFLKEQPDLNYRNPLVLEEMKSILRFWLNEGVDGFRMDAVAHLFEDEQLTDEPLASNSSTIDPDNYDYLSHIHTSQQPEVLDVVAAFREVLEDYRRKDGHARLLMTEAYVSLPETMKYYSTPGRPLAHFPFNFRLITRLQKDFSAYDLYNAISDWLENMPEGAWPNWVLGNHDTKRVATRLGPQMVDAMNMILLLLPGTPITYQGEEIGMEDAEISWAQTQDPAGKRWGPNRYTQFSRDSARTPMQWDSTVNAGSSTAKTTWLPVHPNYRQLNVTSQRADPGSHYNIYKKLVQTRLSNSEVILQGHTDLAVLGKSVFVFSRVKKGSSSPGYIVAVNTEDKHVDVDLSSLVGMKHDVDDATVITRSSHATSQKIQAGKKLSLKSVPLETKVGIVLSFQTTEMVNQ